MVRKGDPAVAGWGERVDLAEYRGLGEREAHPPRQALSARHARMRFLARTASLA